MSKEEFERLWKDSTKEEILTQFYYDYMSLVKLNEKQEKIIKTLRTKHFHLEDETPVIKIDSICDIIWSGEDD